MNDRLSLVLRERAQSLRATWEVSAQADAEALRQAFRRRSKALHPDTTTSSRSGGGSSTFSTCVRPTSSWRTPSVVACTTSSLQLRRTTAPAASPLSAPRPARCMRGTASANAVRSRVVRWFALLLLGLALLLSLVRGAWSRGGSGTSLAGVPRMVVRCRRSASADHAAESALPEGTGGVALQSLGAERIDGDPLPLGSGQRGLEPPSCGWSAKLWWWSGGSTDATHVCSVLAALWPVARADVTAAIRGRS